MKRKNRIALCLAAALLLGLTACGGRSAAPAETPAPSATPVPTATPVPERVLVVYFSPAGEENEKGEAAVLAELLARKLNGDLYEIVPAKGDYPRDRDERMSVAEEELAAKARPPIGGSLPELDGYDAVFIGAPVWYDDWPMIVYSFLEGVDLGEKKLSPFGVYEWEEAPAGLEKKLARICPYSTVTEALLVREENVRERLSAAENSADRWLRRLGYAVTE
ncbi:MAG: hypothetical protein IJH47_09390 [Oscillospiraceae bacterium]|nr:hypothetical protein [Oscillospiraceae bacterium]